MKKYLALLSLLLVGILLLMLGLTIVSGAPEPAPVAQIAPDAAWCDAMLEKPNIEWTDTDARVFGEHCLFE